MRFSFKAVIGAEVVTLGAERIYASKLAERFRVQMNGSSYTIILQSNRPALSAKASDKPVQWHQAEGKPVSKEAVDVIGKAIESKIKKGPDNFQGTFNFITEL